MRRTGPRLGRPSRRPSPRRDDAPTSGSVRSSSGAPRSATIDSCHSSTRLNSPPSPGPGHRRASRPALIADNICTEGIPDLTALPRMTRLVFERGAVIMLGGENSPCTIAGAMVGRRSTAPPRGVPQGGHATSRRDRLGRASRASVASRASTVRPTSPPCTSPGAIRRTHLGCLVMGRIRSTMSSLAQNWSMTQKVLHGAPARGGRPVPGAPASSWRSRSACCSTGSRRSCWPSRPACSRPPSGSAAGRCGRPTSRSTGSQAQRQPSSSRIRGGNWAVTPAVAVNKSQDIITRVVGKPGVVLVSEGPSSRVVPLLANERKKTARWLPEVPIYEIQVGNDEGQVPLLKLQTALNKLPRNLRGGEITDIRDDSTPSATPRTPCPSPRARCRRAPVRSAASARRQLAARARPTEPTARSCRPAAVGVHHHGRDHQADEDRSQDHPPQAQPRPVDPHDLQAERPADRRTSRQPGEHDHLGGEDGQGRHRATRRPVGAPPEQQQRHPDRDQPSRCRERRAPPPARRSGHRSPRIHGDRAARTPRPP